MSLTFTPDEPDKTLPVPAGAPVGGGDNRGGALADDPGSELRIGGLIGFLFFVVFLGWAAFAPLDAGAFARAVVTVDGNRQSVQHRDGGTVSALRVREGDRVTKGQVLARLDLAKLEDAVARSRANLAAARAKVLEAQATVAEVRADLARFRQVAALSGGKVPSKSEMDTAVATLKRAEAAEASARASVAQAEASLKSDETNIDKAHLRSPFDGVVLSRKVEPGQTVAASFQAPILFVLAEDLTTMELQVDVDEADVGQAAVGQKAVFSVDAWPGRRYNAAVTRIGYGANDKDGVISYPGVLAVDNKDLSLRPGMTGTAEITTLTRDNVLLVANAALRFTPPDPEADVKKPANNRGAMSVLLPRT